MKVFTFMQNNLDYRVTIYIDFEFVETVTKQAKYCSVYKYCKWNRAYQGLSLLFSSHKVEEKWKTIVVIVPFWITFWGWEWESNLCITLSSASNDKS